VGRYIVVVMWDRLIVCNDVPHSMLHVCSSYWSLFVLHINWVCIVWQFGDMQGRQPMRPCSILVLPSVPSTPVSMSIWLLGLDVNNDADVDMGAVVVGMSGPAFGMVAMVVVKF